MPDLTIYLPTHGYSISDLVYISWLDGNYYVRDTDIDGVAQSIDANSFKIAATDSDATIVQYTSDVTDGYVREVTESGVATISGLDHLEGETVKVTSNGEVVGTETVSSGSITVSSTVFTYQVGLPYTMKVRTTRLSVPQEGNTIQSRIKRIHETVIRYIRSKLGKSGQEYSGTEYLSDMGTTFSSSSQDDTTLTKGGFTEDAYTVVKSEDPMPMTVLSTIISFEVEERR